MDSPVILQQGVVTPLHWHSTEESGPMKPEKLSGEPAVFLIDSPQTHLRSHFRISVRKFGKILLFWEPLIL